MSRRGPLNQSEREIVTTLIDSKAINFEAIGNVLAKHGPTLPFVLDGEEGFCGTMRNFVRVFRLNNPVEQVEDLGSLRGISGELQG
jgi:hypothetical protein